MSILRIPLYLLTKIGSEGRGPARRRSVPARLPRRNFLCGRSLYRLVPFLWSACSLYGRKQLSAFTESHHHAFMVGINGKLSVRHSRSASRSLLDLLASLARLFASSPTGRAQTLASHKRLCRLRESALHFVTIS